MAHKTMIDGVSYEIKGGKTLVNGTGYEIKNGKTLVGGTVYEVGFAPPTHDVVIACGVSMSSMYNNYKINIDGVSYSPYPAFNMVLKSSSSVTVTVSNALGSVSVNNEKVLSGAGTYTVDLSSVTHVNMQVTGMTLAITTYNVDAQENVTVSVTGTGGAAAACIEYNGITYTSAATFTAKTGDLIWVKAGVQVGYTQYYYVITSNINVKLAASSNTMGSVTITTS